LASLRHSLNLKAPKKKESSFWFRNAFISVSLVALVLFGSFYDGLKGVKLSPELATTILSIDINPSFTLKVDASNIVLSIEAENEDAKTIVVSDLIGQNATLVVETIILRAQEAGYLIDPTQSDYVLVTTAPAKEGDEIAADHLNDLIQEALTKEGGSDDVNVILIKATLQQWFDAQEKGNPLGLFVINGMVNNQGTLMSVSEFLKTSGNLELLETLSTIVKKSTINTLSLLERFLDRLQRAGVDVSAYRARLTTEGENLTKLKEDVLAMWESLDPDTKAGSSLSDADKTAMRDLINKMLEQLSALGIDVSGYQAYLATQYPDLQSIEKELVALLEANGVDTKTGSTLTQADKTKIISDLQKKLDQLRLLGIDITALQNRLNAASPDLYALETDINALLNANGIDTSTGSTGSVKGDDDQEELEEEDKEDEERVEEHKEEREEDDEAHEVDD
jgi:chaperonin cofactor prefoldin